ncbi:MAG: Translocation and assembly module subunit TamA [Xanthomonadales bacterium]|nr:Translocation and assembly module subunit TamA [Xanthomonadales bacterium]
MPCPPPLPLVLSGLARAACPLLLALQLGACALFGAGRVDEAQAVDAQAPRDRSQQRVRIFISGVKGEMKEAVSGALELKGLMSRADASDALVRRVHRRAAGQMKKALQPFGHYHAEIGSTLELQDKTWFARFQVDPGPPTTVAGNAIEVAGPGGEDRRVQRAVAAFEPRVGEILDHRLYEAAKNRIADALAERGYLDARLVEKRVAVRLAERSARVRLKFESGPRFRFAQTRFEGAQLPDEVLAGYLPYQPGQAYRQDRLIELQQRLLDSDYFGEVEIETEQERAVDQQVPIIVRLRPAARTVYTGGLAIGSDSGVGVQGGINRRWLNDRGHKASLRSEISQRLNTFGGQYIIPLPGADRTSWVASLGYRDETTDTSTQKVANLYLAHQHEHEHGSLSWGLAAQSGDFEVGEVPGSSTLVYPEVRFFRRMADDFLAPRQGWSLAVDLRATPGGGDATFAQARAEARLLRPHGDNRWLARLTLGTLWTDDFDKMPPQLRFFAGGDRSLRGFGYQALGPPNALGKVGGGKYLAVTSFEYEKHLFDGFGVAGFVDAGNAFNAGDFELAAGVGVGLRWRSPVGLVRVDLAQPVAGDGDGLRLHLTIGPEL